MIVSTARVVLHIPHSHSLKEKRQAIRPIVAQIQHQFQVSVAEVEDQDRWQTAVLGIACVSGEARHAEEVIARAVHFIESRLGDAVLADYSTETVHVLT